MPRKDYKKIGQALAAGATKKDALMAGGYAATTANRGTTELGKDAQEQISAAYEKALKRNSRHIIDASKNCDTSELRHLARGRLITNAITGKDDAVQSAKAIASLDETGMINPQVAAGIIIIQAVKLPDVGGIPRLPEQVQE